MSEVDLSKYRTRKNSFQRVGLTAFIPALLFSALFLGQPAYAGNKVVIIPLGGDEPATSKLLFMTNGSWKGKLGGVQGADDKCAAEAKSRGIKGRFDALLGTFGRSPEFRSNHYSLFYLRTDGEDLRSSYHSLFSSTGLNNTISTTGIPVEVWTGLDADGRPNGMNNCQDWTSKSGLGRVGISTQYDSAWVSDGDRSCGGFRRLYCIEQ